MATTYYRISEEIRTQLAGSVASDDFSYSLRYIAELVAQQVAVEARKNAFENSNAGETTYSSDLFTSTFTGLSVQYDSTLKQWYVTLPQIPPSLPNDQEIVSVTPLGIQGRRRQIVPMKNKDKFMQDILGTVRGFILYYIDNGKMYFDNIQEYMFTAVNMTMVGTISSTGDIMSATLNVPKDVELSIVDAIVNRLRTKPPADVRNDARDIPTVN